ncbi:hypothetical protein K505DRAFT_18760 [Melanomma pulvis-pyrius CBS 109.77]|uniref:C2H2-type domain-containing protein n=1 Tax=Melanomma pulvis-pyrius CBS 109.77 TaxID=1314802 RepID=A0A6A6XHC1_9PLEO|nr:hypothetical protein K505DRAFT_18760 [Melanomma pulvis-pyrius CBS 109.77]
MDLSSDVGLEIPYPPFPALPRASSPVQASADPAALVNASTPAADPPQHHAPPSKPTPAPSSVGLSPLNSLPTDIATHRALLFALDTPVQLTPAVWDRFWPYIDNVWCLHQKPHPAPSTGVAKVYGGCRLNRKTNFPPPVLHDNSRPRQRREGGTCKAKFRLTIHPDGRRMVERTGEAHSHTLDYIDSVKRNTGVRALVLDDFFKSWEAGGILAFLRDTSAQDATKDILRDAGGLYLSRQEVQNILNSALKKAYPGQDVSEVKKQMDKYKNYTTCNFKGCNAPAFRDIKVLMDHRKQVHGLKSHDHSDKVYACPDKGCWRRKKSKGFATLLGLEEHLRDKHGSGLQAAGLETSDGDILDPIMTNQLAMSDIPQNINADMNSMNSMMGFTSLLPDPITPDSSSEEQQNEVHMTSQELQVEAQEANRALSHMEKGSMKLRIKRLEIEKRKLEQEIRRLNKAVWGNERGEFPSVDVDAEGEGEAG